ncbi:hypothetical protein ACFL6U_13895 [Planctomycetota bacterium]
MKISQRAQSVTASMTIMVTARAKEFGVVALRPEADGATETMRVQFEKRAKHMAERLNGIDRGH